MNTRDRQQKSQQEQWRRDPERGYTKSILSFIKGNERKTRSKERGRDGEQNKIFL